MNVIIRIAAFLLGLILIAPGLCAVVLTPWGLASLGVSIRTRDIGAALVAIGWWALLLAIGWGGVLLLGVAFGWRRKQTAGPATGPWQGASWSRLEKPNDGQSGSNPPSSPA